MSIIYILWLRQLKRYSRSRARIFASLAQPLLFLVAMGFGFGPTYAKAGGGSYIQFLAPGIIGMAIMFTAVFSGIEIIWDRQFGFLKETLVAPVSRLQIVLGRTLGGATVAMLQGAIVAVVCFIAGFRVQNPALVPVAIVFMFLIAVLFASVGTTVGSFVEDMQAFPLIMNFLIMPMFFFSGAIFPVNNLGGILLVLLRLNPFTYGVDGLRGSFTNAFAFGPLADLALLALAAAALLAIGSYF
ncbi:MAG TPA: ABC transporter permease, partial [Chthoniobacteraceae bacterium]|nr:ABC transporter permease [Chthoniobacteraceae bacterium]